MVRVIVIAEGQTEEKFIREVVKPALQGWQVSINPVNLKTSSDKRGGTVAHSGGAVTIDRLKGNAVKFLRSDSQLVLSTFLDLYGLDADFPPFAQASKFSDVYQRVACLERALHTLVVQEAGCRPERFIPYIQPYEFEGLLFSDVDALCAVDPGWARYAPVLHKVRAKFDCPEHINDSPQTAPSKRLLNILKSPGYHKVRHGPEAAKRITLEAIERECPHFKSWMDTLRKLEAP